MNSDAINKNEMKRDTIKKNETKGKEKRSKITTAAGFELARAEPNRFRVCLLNHSDKLSCANFKPILFERRERQGGRTTTDVPVKHEHEQKEEYEWK